MQNTPPSEEPPDLPNREPPPVPLPRKQRELRPLPSQPNLSQLSQSAPVASQPQDKYFQRGKILQELIVTEEVYVDSLRKIIEEYKKPLLTASSPLPAHLAPEVVLKIFSNIEEIHRFNLVLLEHMRRAFPDPANINGADCLGSFFIQMASFLKLYNVYCENHEAATLTLTIHQEKNPNFVTFLQKVQSRQATMLPDLLSRPVQRICKYPLLFRELLKATPDTHPDYPNVQQTLQKLEQIAVDVNQYKDNAESFRKFLEFHDNVIGSIVPPNDKTLPTLIHDEHLVTGESHRAGKEFPRHVYLFSNAVVLTKQSNIPNKEEQTNTFDIKSVLDVKAHPDYKTHFELQMNSGSIFFICPSFASRTLWMSKIQATMKGEIATLSVKVHNSSKLPLKKKTDLPRRPTNLDQIPKLANFLAQHLMDSPQYSLLLPNAFERKEFLSDIILLNYLSWVWEEGELWYMWQEDGQTVRGLSGWIGRDVPLEVPITIKMSTVLEVWNRFSFTRASVLKAFSASLEEWLTKHRPPGAVFLAHIACDKTDSEGLYRCFEKVRRVRWPDLLIWTYTFVPSFGESLSQLGFIQQKAASQLIIEDVGSLNIYGWIFNPNQKDTPERSAPRHRPKSEPPLKASGPGQET